MLSNFDIYFSYWGSLRSKRFRASSSREVGARAKLKEWRGRGRGKKEPLARKPHDFEKLRSPTNAASDWCGAGSVDILSTRNINQTRYALFTCATDLVLSDLCSQFGLIWIVFVRRFYYKIRVFKVLWEIEQWRLGKVNLLGMTACGSDWKKWTVCWR